MAGAAALLAGLLLSSTASAQTTSYAPLPLFPASIFHGVAPAEPVQEPAVQERAPQELDDAAALDPRLRRQIVSYNGREAAGTVIVDTPNTYLYYVLGNGQAIRYGVGVGRDGFRWGGIHKISRKQEWPDWTPPPEMIERQPYLPRFMAGGPGNPMGARALYIGSTVYRVHGTNAPETIGHAVSSGCFRLVNSEIEDLYSRVPVGTKIVVQHR